MTDAEKLRSIGRNYVGYDFAKVLFRIADLLDAVPPETLEALKAGTWKAVPMEPTYGMLEALIGAKSQLEASQYCYVLKYYHSMLVAAPAKPEE